VQLRGEVRAVKVDLGRIAFRNGQSSMRFSLTVCEYPF
jgi:hypothetical protein